MRVSKSEFGVFDGKTVHKFDLDNGKGITASVITYGGVLQSLKVPNRDGVSEEITVNYDNLADITTKSSYFGSTCGRVANRISGASFVLDGERHQLNPTNGTLTLHGGIKNWAKVVWEAKEIQGTEEVGVELSLVSPDKDEGFPGTVKITVLIKLNTNNEIIFDYTATTDKATPLNPTNHTYWNLSGNYKSTIKTQKVQLFSDLYTPINQDLVPTGEVLSVQGTRFDLREPVLFGEKINEENGIDHNFVIARQGKEVGELCEFGSLYDPESGRHMRMFTTEIGVQVYTFNFGKDTFPYTKHNAVCFETQKFPNSINTPSFPSCVLRPGQVYRQTTLHRFTVQ
eukprot:c16045_g1_i1.p1 GENE.c16045_g1_i1~~c16045_g1_i1.p1  ORF type:complete len:342 (-),score=156.12 c16045_g1_i1:33-1058(-)